MKVNVIWCIHTTVSINIVEEFLKNNPQFLTFFYYLLSFLVMCLYMNKIMIVDALIEN